MSKSLHVNLATQLKKAGSPLSKASVKQAILQVRFPDVLARFPDVLARFSAIPGRSSYSCAHVSTLGTFPLLNTR